MVALFSQGYQTNTNFGIIAKDEDPDCANRAFAEVKSEQEGETTAEEEGAALPADEDGVTYAGKPSGPGARLTSSTLFFRPVRVTKTSSSEPSVFTTYFSR